MTTSMIRVTDMWVGVCNCHPPSPPIPMTGFVITGSGDVSANNLGMARIGDIVIGTCGHVGTIVTGSSVSKANNIGKARSGDLVAGCTIGTLVGGSGDCVTT